MIKPAKQYSETPYGFIWNQVKVERCCSFPHGDLFVLATTGKNTLHIRVTPSGLFRAHVTKNKPQPLLPG